MKLKLNKKTLKNLSNDSTLLPMEATPHIGGGKRRPRPTDTCTKELLVTIPPTSAASLNNTCDAI